MGNGLIHRNDSGEQDSMKASTKRPRIASSGFSLVELTIVLLIIALLVGGMVVPLSAQRDMQNVSATEKQMAEIREALLGFAINYGRLPCPDTDQDGKEDIALPVVSSGPLSGQQTEIHNGCLGALDEGGLPFATLGVPPSDAWGNRFRYRVSGTFTQSRIVRETATGNVISATPGFALGSPGDIEVMTRGNTGSAKGELLLASTLPVVILSHGKNGYGTWSANGAALAAPPATNTDERMNADVSSKKKVSRFATPEAIPCSDSVVGPPFCEFDDIVVWISRYALFNRLISAGRLP